MAEQHDGGPTARLLADVAAEVGGYVKPAGAAAAMAMARRRRRGRVVAVGVLAVVALVGSVLGYAWPRDGQRAPAPGSSTDPAQVWQEFVNCARSHGRPDFPYPQLGQNGSVNFPEGFNANEALVAVDNDCGSILDQLPPKARLNHSR